MTEAAHRIPSYWDEILDLALGLGRSRNAFAGSTASARPVECEWVSAVFLVGHKSTFERIRGFDPEYFMYVEDLDLFRRLRDNGGLCLWDPRASVIHHGGVDAESRGAISAELYALTIWNIRRYFEKHEPSWKEWRGRSLLLAGALGCFLRGASWGWRGAAERARRVTRGKPWPDTLALARMFTIAGWLCAKASVSCRLPSRIQDHLLLLRGPDLPKIS